MNIGELLDGGTSFVIDTSAWWRLSVLRLTFCVRFGTQRSTTGC